MRCRFSPRGAALLSLILISPWLQAGELINADAYQTEDHYTLSLDMRIQGSHHDVYAVLMDFNNMHIVNDTIKTSQLLQTKDQKYYVKYVSEGCILAFCQTITQVAAITELGRGYIMGKVDPSQSDIRYGRTLWQVIDEGETTRIKYNADYVPDFWVPPLIGDYILKERLIEEGIKTINGIEKLITVAFEE